MAERIVNNGLAFAYASNDAFFEIKSELEKYFLYQTVLIIDQNFEYGNVIERLIQNVNCNFLVSHDVKEIDFSQNIDFVVAINDKDIFEIKQKSFENKIPYMIVLTKAESSCIVSKYILKNEREVEVNKPFGIILDKSQVFEKKNFVCKVILEMSSVKFDIVQKKICNLFYSKKIDYDLISDQEKVLSNLMKIFENDNFDNSKLFDEICDLYVTNCIKKVDDEIGILDKLALLYFEFCSQNYSKYIEIKHIFKQTLQILEKTYFEKYQNGFKNSINYIVHQNKLVEYGKHSEFKAVMIPESKINFLLEQFKNKLLSLSKEQIDFDEKIKNIVADRDIDFLYGLYSYVDRDIFVDMLSLQPSIFIEPSFLSLIYSQGLLNYDF